MVRTVIDPCIWEDPEFVGLDLFAQHVWFYLLLGPEARTACPGLVRLGVGGLAEALRASSQDVHVALGRLEKIGWLRVHGPQRVIHIPKAPTWRGGGNGKIIRGWYRRWQSVPEGPWKQAHIAAMEVCRPSTGTAWEETFGTEPRKPLPVPGKGFPDLLSAFPADLENTVGKSILAPRKAQEGDPEQDPEQEEDPEQDPDAPEAERLWLLQEQLRADLGLPKLRATPGRIGLVAIALQQFSAEELEHVLRVFRRQACEDPRQGDWLDGRRNWLPQCIEPRLGQSAKPNGRKPRDIRVGYVEPKANEDYGPPGVVEDF